jgi:FkbM family methyltransferase
MPSVSSVGGKIVRALRNPLRSASRVLKLSEIEVENGALRSQLSAVGQELAQARAQIRQLQFAVDMQESEQQIEYRERRKLFLIPRLLELLNKEERFVIVDAGAREVERDPRWRPFPPERLEFVGFEPDRDEAARLNSIAEKEGLKRHFVAAGLWGASGTIEFEHNNIGGGSSFLPQNREVTDRWKFENPHETSLARDIFFPVRREPMAVVNLVDWAKEAKIGSVDFLKLNVQGGEKEILLGAGSLLSSVLGILVEVAFVESYRDRPMFVDIDVLLRERGFVFFDLLAHHYIGRAGSPIAAQHLTVAGGKLSQLVSEWGQLIEGHAIYFRDPIGGTGQLDFMRTIKLAALAEAYGQVEYAFELLGWLAGQKDVADDGKSQMLQRIVREASNEYRTLLRPGLLK